MGYPTPENERPEDVYGPNDQRMKVAYAPVLNDLPHWA